MMTFPFLSRAVPFSQCVLTETFRADFFSPPPGLVESHFCTCFPPPPSLLSAAFFGYLPTFTEFPPGLGNEWLITSLPPSFPFSTLSPKVPPFSGGFLGRSQRFCSLCIKETADYGDFPSTFFLSWIRSSPRASGVSMVR